MKNVFSYLLLMAAVVAMPAVFTSCGDDEPETPENPENPDAPENPDTPQSPVVGTWVDEWDMCYVFRADGTGMLAEDYQEYPGGVDFCEIKYTYDDESKELIIYLLDDGIWEYDETYYVVAFTDEYAIVQEGDDDEMYKFARQTTPLVTVDVEEKGPVREEWGERCYEYYVDSKEGSCYFDIEPHILWHENLPPLTLKSTINKYDRIGYEVIGDNPCYLSVRYSDNNTTHEKLSTIELQFANADNSVRVTCPITIHQEPAY